MKKRNIHIIFVVITGLMFLSSCATMFNSKTTNLTIITNQPSKLVFENDTLEKLSMNKTLTVNRDKKPLILTAFNDTLSHTVKIQSKNSFAYWLNLYPNLHLWTGFIIDTKTKKRYTYPKTIYLDLNKKDSTYLTYLPLENPYDEKSSNIFKITPLKFLGTVNPSIEISYERKTGRIFSTQIMASYLFPMTIMDIGNEFKPNISGFRVSLEEKLYLKKSAPIGPYISFEFNYLKNQYQDVWMFGVENIYSDTTYNYTNYEDTYGINKQTYSFNLKLGYQLITKRLSFDFFGGLGIRYKDVVHFDRINPNDKMEMPRHPNVYYISNKEGKYWTISIPLNVRIGWTF